MTTQEKIDAVTAYLSGEFYVGARVKPIGGSSIENATIYAGKKDGWKLVYDSGQHGELCWKDHELEFL